jgi:hypothetical protein
MTAIIKDIYENHHIGLIIDIEIQSPMTIRCNDQFVVCPYPCAISPKVTFKIKKFRDLSDSMDSLECYQSSIHSLIIEGISESLIKSGDIIQLITCTQIAEHKIDMISTSYYINVAIDFSSTFSGKLHVQNLDDLVLGPEEITVSWLNSLKDTYRKKYTTLRNQIHNVRIQSILMVKNDTKLNKLNTS